MPKISQGIKQSSAPLKREFKFPDPMTAALWDCERSNSELAGAQVDLADQIDGLRNEVRELTDGIGKLVEANEKLIDAIKDFMGSGKGGRS